MSLPHSFLSGKGGGPLTLFDVLIGFGATEVSSNVFRLTVPGSYNIDLQGLPVSVHVIGAGGTSGWDGMGYGNCGGGGGGGGAVASFSGINGVNFQVGQGHPPYQYVNGLDGSHDHTWMLANYPVTATQDSWFLTSTTLAGRGGQNGTYNNSPVEDAGGGGWDANTTGGTGSNGGNGGGAGWNSTSNDTRIQPQSSTYGGGGGGQGNHLSGGYGASGAFGGIGGRGGVPNGVTDTAWNRENSIGTLGGGNGGQGKHTTTNTPFTTIGSSNGVIQFDFN
jgi:hypothetical protein